MPSFLFIESRIVLNQEQILNRPEVTLESRLRWEQNHDVALNHSLENRNNLDKFHVNLAVAEVSCS